MRLDSCLMCANYGIKRTFILSASCLQLLPPKIALTFADQSYVYVASLATWRVQQPLTVSCLEFLRISLHFFWSSERFSVPCLCWPQCKQLNWIYVRMVEESERYNGRFSVWQTVTFCLIPLQRYWCVLEMSGQNLPKTEVVSSRARFRVLTRKQNGCLKKGHAPKGRARNAVLGLCPSFTILQGCNRGRRKDLELGWWPLIGASQQSDKRKSDKKELKE